MPKRQTEIIAHSALTNHRIPARPAEPVPALTPYETAGLIVVNARPGTPPPLADITRLRAYRDLIYKDPSFEQRYFALLEQLSTTQPGDPFVQAALGHKALTEGHFETALDHLTKAKPLEESAVYLDLGQAFAKLGRNEEATQSLEEGRQLDPFNAQMWKTLILQYINDKRYSEAADHMKKYLVVFPQDSFMRGLLARVK